jgi:hypothetical protein
VRIPSITKGSDVLAGIALYLIPGEDVYRRWIGGDPTLTFIAQFASTSDNHPHPHVSGNTWDMDLALPYSYLILYHGNDSDRRQVDGATATPEAICTHAHAHAHARSHAHAHAHASNRLLCSTCGTSRSFDQLIEEYTRLQSTISNLKEQSTTRKSPAASAVDQYRSVLSQLREIVRSSHYSVVGFLKNCLLEELILRGLFAEYIAVARDTNYLASISACYPTGHPVPAVQAAMYGKCLLYECRSVEDMQEAQRVLSFAREALRISHGKDSQLVQDISELLSGLV